MGDVIAPLGSWFSHPQDGYKTDVSQGAGVLKRGAWKA